MLAEMHRFFDRRLKGMKTGIFTQDPIYYYTVNAPAGTEWRSSKTWPVAGTQTTFTVRFDVDSSTSAKQPAGMLAGAPPRPVEPASKFSSLQANFRVSSRMGQHDSERLQLRGLKYGEM